jgi:hypothetical protein
MVAFDFASHPAPDNWNVILAAYEIDLACRLLNLDLVPLADNYDINLRIENFKRAARYP